MFGSKAKERSDENVHSSYADPLASLLVGYLDESWWTFVVRSTASADEICSWLARYSDVRSNADSDYMVEWRSGTARYRFQLLEVPPLSGKDAANWNLPRRWRKQGHRCLVGCIVDWDGDSTPGIVAMERLLRSMAATLGGETRTISKNEPWKQALKREMKVAQGISLICADPSVTRLPAPAESRAIKAQLTPVPMTSAEKPDINGFCEGQRVRLVNPFVGDDLRYDAGHEGTILVTKTSPADVSLCRQADMHEVFMDDRRLIMTSGQDLEMISGYAEVIYSADGEHVDVNVKSSEGSTVVLLAVEPVRCVSKGKPVHG